MPKLFACVAFAAVPWLVGLASPTKPVRCLRLVVGPWSRPLGADTAYYRVPTLVRLQGYAERATSGSLTPNIAYPFPDTFPDLPAWTRRRGTLELLWSNGYAVTRVVLRPARDSLVGIATAEPDVILVPPKPTPQAKVVGRWARCPRMSGPRPAP